MKNWLAEFTVDDLRNVARLTPEGWHEFSDQQKRKFAADVAQSSDDREIEECRKFVEWLKQMSDKSDRRFEFPKRQKEEIVALLPAGSGNLIDEIEDDTRKYLDEIDSEKLYKAEASVNALCVRLSTELRETNLIFGDYDTLIRALDAIVGTIPRRTKQSAKFNARCDARNWYLEKLLDALACPYEVVRFQS
jgi:hypothetical protein